MAPEEKDKVENPATAGHGDMAVRSHTPKTEKGEIDPSAPNDVNRTVDRK